MPEFTALAKYATRIDHVTIAVPDLEKAMGFYTLLGFTLVERKVTKGETTSMERAIFRVNDMLVVLLQGHQSDSQINRYISAYGPGVHHVAFEVKSVEKLMDILSASGVKFIGTPTTDEQGITQIFTERDPDSGMIFEFIEHENNSTRISDTGIASVFQHLETHNVY